MEFGQNQLRAQYNEQVARNEARAQANALALRAQNISKNIEVLSWVVLRAPIVEYAGTGEGEIYRDPVIWSTQVLLTDIYARPLIATIELGADNEDDNVHYFVEVKDMPECPFELVFGARHTAEDRNDIYTERLAFDTTYPDSRYQPDLRLADGNAVWASRDLPSDRLRTAVAAAEQSIETWDAKLSYVFEKLADPSLNPQYSTKIDYIQRHFQQSNTEL